MTHATITLQPIEKPYLEPLASFAAEQFSENFEHLYDPEPLAEHLEGYFSPAYFTRKMAEGSQVHIAIDDGKVVGYIMFGPMQLPFEHQAGDVEIKRLYVHPTLQRAGIGKQLMAIAFEELPSDVDMYLGVWSENFKAQAFYKQYGFEKVGSYDYRVGPHTDHEFVMRRTEKS